MSFRWGIIVALIGVVMVASLVSLRAQSHADQTIALEKLGGLLFSSQALSENGARSCASCHVPSLSFSGDQPTAISLKGVQQRRRAPSLYGVTRAKALMWDGRVPDLEHQVLLPLEGAEMQIDWSKALEQITRQPEVVSMARDASFTLDRETIIEALVAYVRSLDRAQSRFDRFMHGATYELTEQEQRGLRLFQRKARCASCHLSDSRSAPFTDGDFHVTGAGFALVLGDRGRAEVTGDLKDVAAFKTPSLRGVSLRPFLMHNGQMRSLKEVVEYYNSADSSALPQIDSRLVPLRLTADEIDDLIAFLGSLTPITESQF